MKVKFVYFSIFILKIFEKKLRKIISLCIYFSFGQMNFRNFGQKKTDLLLGLTHIHTRPQQNWGYAKSYGFSNLVSEESIPLPVCLFVTWKIVQLSSTFSILCFYHFRPNFSKNEKVQRYITYIRMTIKEMLLSTTGRLYTFNVRTLVNEPWLLIIRILFEPDLLWVNISKESD